MDGPVHGRHVSRKLNVTQLSKHLDPQLGRIPLNSQWISDMLYPFVIMNHQEPSWTNYICWNCPKIQYMNMNNIRVATTTSHARRKFGSVSDEVGDVHWHLINLGGVEPSKLRVSWSDVFNETPNGESRFPWQSVSPGPIPKWRKTLKDVTFFHEEDGFSQLSTFCWGGLRDIPKSFLTILKIRIVS